MGYDRAATVASVKAVFDGPVELVERYQTTSSSGPEELQDAEGPDRYVNGRGAGVGAAGSRRCRLGGS
jgi:hypothetical protein